MREGNETPSSYVRSVSVLSCVSEQLRADAFRPAYVSGGDTAAWQRQGQAWDGFVNAMWAEYRYFSAD